MCNVNTESTSVAILPVLWRFRIVSNSALYDDIDFGSTGNR